jgi:hypothetical protein
MNPLQYIHKYPESAEQILGISYNQFLQVLKAVEIYQREQQVEKELYSILLDRNITPKKSVLSTCEQVCLCLFYLRHLPTFEELGLQFGISMTEASEFFFQWLSILLQLLPVSYLEQLEKSVDDYENVQKLLAEFRLLINPINF